MDLKAIVDKRKAKFKALSKEKKDDVLAIVISESSSRSFEDNQFRVKVAERGDVKVSDLHLFTDTEVKKLSMKMTEDKFKRAGIDLTGVKASDVSVDGLPLSMMP